MTIAVRNDGPDLAAVTDGGERVVHLYPNSCFYAHLSIYHFALPFARNGLVLDAGSGTGYGSCYLADRGARFVEAIDFCDRAVAFSREHFPRPNLRFQVMDLETIAGLPARQFDLVFTSNALEHVFDVTNFFRSAWHLLKREGTVVVAVPPITNDQLKLVNLANLHHLNIWSPRQWHHVLQEFFAEIQCYQHGFCKPGIALDFGDTPAQTQVTEEDFQFERIALEEFYTRGTCTVIFVARQPRAAKELPPLGSPPTFVDDSFTRLTIAFAPRLVRAAAPEPWWTRLTALKRLPVVGGLAMMKAAFPRGNRDG